MSQQINLFNEKARRRSSEFSALNMMQALGAILLCVVVLYVYSLYEENRLVKQHAGAVEMLVSEQKRFATLTADYSRQRAGLTLEQELKKVTGEAIAQREIIHSLKSGVIGNTTGYSLYMQAFSRQMVNGLWLTGFNIEGDAMQMGIRGATLNPELVPGYIMRLSKENVMRGKTFASLQMQLAKEETGKPTTLHYLEFILQSVVETEADKR